MDPSDARRAWTLLEPYHAVVYFAPEAKPAYTEAGLKGGWMGYFASRSAAMGPVPADVVIATFYNFHPTMVRRAIPDAWSFSTPERVLAARYRIADTVLRRFLGDMIESHEVAEAAELTGRAARACTSQGRPLFAAHAALSWPDEPHMVLWHAATLLREFRGDGHVATLLTDGIDGCEAHVLLAAEGRFDPAQQRLARGWSEEEWDEAADRLRNRDLLDDTGVLTDMGRALRVSVEDHTDALAAPPYEALSAQERARLSTLMEMIGEAVARGASIPYPNPIGLTRA